MLSIQYWIPSQLFEQLVTPKTPNGSRNSLVDRCLLRSSQTNMFGWQNFQFDYPNFHIDHIIIIALVEVLFRFQNRQTRTTIKYMLIFLSMRGIRVLWCHGISICLFSNWQTYYTDLSFGHSSIMIVMRSEITLQIMCVSVI